jgi:chromosome segregation ATPase
MKLAIIEDKKKKLKGKLKSLNDNLDEERYEYDMDYAKEINIKLNAFKVIKEEFDEKEEKLRSELGPKGMFRVDELEEELEVQREQLIELKRAFKMHKVKKDIYEQLRMEYSTGFREAEKELHELRSNIIRWLSSEKSDKNRLENRIRLLQGRYKTREIDEEDFNRQKKDINNEVERISQRVKILELYSRTKKKRFF